jgi:ubiquinone biosynthesis protein
MDIIKTGIGLTKTIRNITRLREIVAVFAKNGFSEFVGRGVAKKVPDFVLPNYVQKLKVEMAEKGEENWAKIIGHRLKLSFEELGPAFVKFGQLLSSREDLFPVEFIDELKTLRDNVKGIPFTSVIEEIERSTGKKYTEIFKSIEEVPIGQASIGVVHKGLLLDGAEVVVKVRRPNIKKIIETDLDIIHYLASQLEKVSEEIRYLGITRIVYDFAVTFQNELNFHVEGLNCERFEKTLEEVDKDKIFYVPKVYRDISTEDILIMECLNGIPFTDPSIKEKLDEGLKENLTSGVSLFLQCFLKIGFFHADLHGGNLFLLDNGKIGIIDFGLMGSLSKKNRLNFMAIIYALITHNYENLVYEFLDVAEYDNIPDVEELIRDVRTTMSPFVGLTLSQTNFSEIMQAVITTLSKHQIFLPREWFVVFRSLTTLDGVGQSLDIEFDIFGILDQDIKEILQSSFTKDDVIEEAVWAGRDIASTFRIIPRHVKWFLKEWAQRKYAFEIIHTGHEKQFKKVSNSIYSLGGMIVTAVFIYSGVQVLGGQVVTHWSQIPVLSWIFWGLAILNFLQSGFKIGR